MSHFDLPVLCIVTGLAIGAIFLAFGFAHWLLDWMDGSDRNSA